VTLTLLRTPDRYLTREQLAERMGLYTREGKLNVRQVTRLGFPRYPGARGGLYVWEEVVAEMQRRKAARDEQRRAG
jgi:hypothetical protein